MRKIFIPLIAVVFLLAGCGGGDTSPALPTVVVEKAATAALPTNLDLTGSLEPLRETVVAAKAAGRIVALNFAEGDRVTSGARLVQLDASTESATLSSVERNMLEAQNSARAVAALFDQRIQNAGTNLANLRETGERSLALVETQLATARADLDRNSESLATEVSILLEQTTDGIDQILGITAKHKNENDAFESLLGSLSQNSKVAAENTFREFLTAAENFRTDFNSNIFGQSPSATVVNQNLTLAQTALESAKNSLEKVYEMLKKTSSGGALSDAQINAFKQSITTLGGTVEGTLLSVKTLQSGGDLSGQIAVLEKSLEQSRAQITANTESAELAITALEKEKTAQLASANALVESLRGQLSVNSTLLADTTVTAPFSGLVVQKIAESGEVVNPGTPLLKLIDDAKMKLVLGVPDSAVGSLAVGRTATITIDSLSGQNFSGRISKIASSADVSSKKIDVEIELANPDHTLKIGMFARANFEFAGSEGIVIPAAALVNRYEQNFVFVVEDGRAVQKNVTVGNRSSDFVEISSGLTAGENVITKGQRYLRDGDAISILNSSNE